RLGDDVGDRATWAGDAAVGDEPPRSEPPIEGTDRLRRRGQLADPHLRDRLPQRQPRHPDLRAEPLEVFLSHRGLVVRALLLMELDRPPKDRLGLCAAPTWGGTGHRKLGRSKSNLSSSVVCSSGSKMMRLFK